MTRNPREGNCRSGSPRYLQAAQAINRKLGTVQLRLASCLETPVICSVDGIKSLTILFGQRACAGVARAGPFSQAPFPATPSPPPKFPVLGNSGEFRGNPVKSGQRPKKSLEVRAKSGQSRGISAFPRGFLGISRQLRTMSGDFCWFQKICGQKQEPFKRAVDGPSTIGPETKPQ